MNSNLHNKFIDYISKLIIEIALLKILLTTKHTFGNINKSKINY